MNTDDRQMSFDEYLGSPLADVPNTPQEPEVEPEVTGGLAIFDTRTPQFDPSEVSMPTLRLGQMMTGEVIDHQAQPGQWILTGWDPQDELTVVPLGLARNRTLRDPDTRGVLCHSDDALFGHGTPGIECAKCDLKDWSGDSNNRKAPPCQFAYVYLVYVADFDTIATVAFKSSALRVGKEINALILRFKLGNFAVKLGSEKSTKGRKGAYFIPTIDLVKQVDRSIIEAAQSAL